MTATPTAAATRPPTYPSPDAPHGSWHTVPVAELFGPTIQGEGPHTGRRAMFVRLGMCNLSCAWCDTPYTWDADRYDLDREIRWTRADDIAAAVLEPRPAPPLVVLTGGEPLMHQRRPGFLYLIERLTGDDREVHVETNGTIVPHGPLLSEVRMFAVSPKLASNDADPESRRIRSKALAVFAELAYGGVAFFKFVARDRDDLDEIDRIVADHSVPAAAVWVMPEGTDPTTLLIRHRHLMPAVMERGYNTTARLHTLLWGDQRGR